jgi:hypothetical protein
MAKILDMNSAKAPKTPALPTASEIALQLNQLLASLMAIFRQNGVPGFHIVSIGVILAQLKFVDDAAGRMTPAEVEMIVQKQAQAQLEDMRLWLLKQSVPSSTLIN